MKHTINNWSLQLNHDLKEGKITKAEHDVAMKVVENWKEVYEVYRKQGRIK